MPPGHDGMDLLYERHSGPILLAYGVSPRTLKSDMVGTSQQCLFMARS